MDSRDWVTYVVAACRLDSLMSVVFLEGDSSSTGEMNPSASSSMWSRKLMTLISGCTLMVNCVFESPSSSEPSSSSCRERTHTERSVSEDKAVSLRQEATRREHEDRAVLVTEGYKTLQCSLKMHFHMASHP